MSGADDTEGTIGGERDRELAKTPRNHRTIWTPQQITRLQNLAVGNTPTRLIALKLQRTQGAIRSKSSQRRVSLKPTNQSPHNRRAGE